MRKLVSLGLALILCLGLFAPRAAAGPMVNIVVMDGDGRGIVGAEVELYKLGAGLGGVYKTGFAGALRLEQPLDAGSLWQLRVSAPGYRTLQTGWIDLTQAVYHPMKLERLAGTFQATVRTKTGEPLSGSVRVLAADGSVVGTYPITEGSMKAVDLPAGEYRALIQAEGQRIQAWPASVKSGQVTALLAHLEPEGSMITGEVRDAVTGQALAGAVVELLSDEQTRLSTQTADSQGRFAIEAPEGGAGTYRLRARAPGHGLLMTEPFSVTPGQRLDRSGGEALTLAPLAGRVEGLVVGREGNPVEGAVVVIQRKGWGEVAETKTSRDGAFSFTDLPVGSGLLYRVTVQTGYAAMTTNWAELKAGPPNPVSVQFKQDVYYDFESGSVTGAVVSPSGAPVAGAKVELIRQNRVQAQGTTDASGTFLIRDVRGTQQFFESEPYLVRVSKEGYVPTREFEVGGEESVGLAVPAYSRAVLRATLRPAVVELRGRVTDSAGRPVAGAHVQFTPVSGGSAVSGSTGADGRYAIKGADLTKFASAMMMVRAKGYLGLDRAVELSGEGSVEPVTLTSERAVITGQVFGPEGQPRADVLVEVRAASGRLVAQGRSDASGVYRLEAVVPQAGPIYLNASGTGYQESMVEVASPPAGGATLMKDLVLFPVGAAFEGHVLDDLGQPVAGRVELLEEGIGLVETAPIDASGAYRFSAVRSRGSGWFWLRVVPQAGTFAGSLTHRSEWVPLIRPVPGSAVLTDLSVSR